MVSDDESEDDYYEAGDESENNDNESTTTSESVAANKNEQRTFGETKEDTAHPPPISAALRGGDPAPNIPHLSDLVNQFSELIVRPIESHLKDLVSITGLKPELLIIPQGQTFNIPYSTLRLENGQPLCSLVAPREAFSFHSYSYSTRLQQEATSHVSENAQFAATLLTSCNKVVINKSISECVRMACDILLTASLLQIVNRLVTS